MIRQNEREPHGRAGRSSLTIWALGAVTLIVAAAVFGLRSRSGTSDASVAVVTPKALGVPRLALNKTEIDEGDVPLDSTVLSEFELTNVGDMPLEITEKPKVELVEGC